MTDLKQKSRYTNEDVQATWNKIVAGKLGSKDYAEQLIANAIEETQQVIEQYNIKNIAYSWSGGKDSRILEPLINYFDLSQGVCGIVKNLEFRELYSFLERTKPNGLEIYERQDMDLEWLKDNQKYLFPTDSKLGYFWTLQGTRHAQHQFIDLYQPQLMINGRRYKDNNFLPKGDYAIANTYGTKWYSPVRHWSHEDVLIVNHYYDLELAPTYSWPEGWTCGTGPWAGRHRSYWSLNDAWHNTCLIDSSVVISASEVGIESATRYLNDRLENHTNQPVNQKS